MNAAYELQQAVQLKDFESFSRLVDSGADVSQRLFNNDTLLHLLARIDWSQSTTQSVKSIFRPTPTIMDWLQKIRSSLQRTMPIKEFFTLQNDLSQTCMHAAITNENWIFSKSVLTSFYINYHVDSSLYRRDQQGVTESELFLILYGIKGRDEQFRILFEGSECSIRALKSALKAFKVINLNYEQFAILPNTHHLFDAARELDYPDPYAEIDDANILERVYEENGMVDPNKKVRERKRINVQRELEPIANGDYINEERDHVLAFLRDYADVLLSRSCEKNYIITCAREFCSETPSFFMAGLKGSVIDDLKAMSNSSKFSQYSELISKLVAKFKDL